MGSLTEVSGSKVLRNRVVKVVQRVLAVAILSIHPSVTQVDQSKTVQDRITKSSLSAVWKTLVSGTVKLFYKFEGFTPNEGAK